jgi:putative ABC transport system permease protein
MRPEPPANFRPSLLERAGLGRLFSHSFRIAVRNLERKPTQALFTIAGLALATGLLIIPNTLKSGIADILDNQWDVVQRQDLNLGVSEPSSVRILHEFERLPGVIHVEPARGVAVRIHFQGRSRQIGLRSLDPGAQHSRALDQDSREITPESGSLIMSAKLADVLGAHVGDDIIVEALEGRRPMKPFRLGALAEDFTGIVAYLDRQSINRFLGEGDVINGASITIDMTHRADFLHAIKTIPRISWIAIKETMRTSFRNTTAQMMGMLTTLYLSMAVIVAFGVIYNNARISLAERARELATLRVIGMTQREVGSVIVIELGLLAVLAVPIGLLCGTGFATVIIRSVNTETVRVPLVFTSYTYTFAVLVVGLASVVSSMVVLRKLKQLDLIGALKAPE